MAPAEGRVEVLLGHPGKPYFSHKDKGAWTVLKGEIHRRAAGGGGRIVEFEEEMTVIDEAPMVELGEIRQNSGKVVVA